MKIYHFILNDFFVYLLVKDNMFLDTDIYMLVLVYLWNRIQCFTCLYNDAFNHIDEDILILA